MYATQPMDKTHSATADRATTLLHVDVESLIVPISVQ